MAFPYGQQVVAGTNAVADDFNNGRKDALTRWLKFEVIGTLATGNGQGGSFVIPFAGTVVKIKHKTTSGTATIRLQKDGSDIDASISVTSTVADETTITTPSFTSGQKITLDITAVSSGVDLIVMVEVLATP